MFNRLLVAVDGSESSLNALKESLRFAQGGSSTVRVVSVIPPYEGELRLVGVKNIAATMRGPYEEALAQSEKIARDQGVRVQTLLAQGEPHEIIPEFAEAEKCDLIVVGVRGFNPAETVVLGSMTARIIGYSRINILVVPLQTTIGLTRLLVAVDGSNLGKKAVDLARNIQKSYGSKISLIAVADVPPHLYGVDPIAAHSFIEKTRATLEESLGLGESYRAETQLILREGDPASTINEVARSEQIDLILMGSHGRTGLIRLLMGSVTERVIGHAPCPILVTRG